MVCSERSMQHQLLPAVLLVILLGPSGSGEKNGLTTTALRLREGSSPTFLADPADITKDMYGKWKYTGSHEQAFLSYLNSSNQLVVTQDVAHPSSAMKLRRMYSVHPSNAKEVLNDVFGNQVGECFYKGLVDASNKSDFYAKLSILEKKWQLIEDSSLGCKRGFPAWFQEYKAGNIADHLLRPVRIAAGLRDPPVSFSTNASESINSLLKSKTNYKRHQIPAFIDKVLEIYDDQDKELERAIVNRRKYQFQPEYKNLQVDEFDWFLKTPEERHHHIQKVYNANINIPCPSQSWVESPCSSSSQVQPLELPCSQVGIFHPSQAKEPSQSKEPFHPSQSKELFHPSQSKELFHPSQSKELFHPSQSKQLFHPSQSKELFHPSQSKELFHPSQSKELFHPSQSKEPLHVHPSQLHLESRSSVTNGNFMPLPASKTFVYGTFKLLPVARSSLSLIHLFAAIAALFSFPVTYPTFSAVS